MPKPNRATKEKRDRERARKERKQEKEERRLRRKEEKMSQTVTHEEGVDPDLIGIFPGPQPNKIDEQV